MQRLLVSVRIFSFFECVWKISDCVDSSGIEMANTEMEVEVMGGDKEMIKRIRVKIKEWGDFPYYYQFFNALEAPCFFSHHVAVALQKESMETFCRVCEFQKSFDFSIEPQVVGCKVEPCSYSRLEKITCFSKDGHLRNTLSGRLFKGRIGERQVIVKTWDLLLPRGHGYHHVQRPLKFCDEIELFIDENTNSHPNLAKLVTYCYEKRLAAVYDGTLTTVLSDVLLQDTFGWDKRVKVAIQLADLLSWLHDKGTAVGNVTGSCIMIDEDANIKVFDFGYVSNPENKDSTELKKFPVGFDAPEAEHGKRTMKSDVYPFGLLLLQLVTKREWEFILGMDREDLERSILDVAENGKNFLVNECFKEVDYIAALRITNLIKLCTNIDPEGRPTMKVVLAKLRSLQKEDIGGADKRKRDENGAEQNKKFSTGA